MTPKEIVLKGYDCFATGDIETFISLFHEDCKVVNNGMHKFSGTYDGIESFVALLSQIPSHFENFTVKCTHQIAEGNEVFSQVHGTADGMDANFGHYHKIEDGKIKEFWIYDDSQKLAATMKAV